MLLKEAISAHLLSAKYSLWEKVFCHNTNTKKGGTLETLHLLFPSFLVFFFAMLNSSLNEMRFWNECNSFSFKMFCAEFDCYTKLNAK